jgi:hypothetical protein
MGIFSRKPQVYVDTSKFENWPVVSDYQDLETALAFRDQVRTIGFAAELTSDWPLKNNGDDDIALRVKPRGLW